jgi:hypothetical protein
MAEEFVYSEESAKKALNTLLDNADQLEQVAKNIRRIRSELDDASFCKLGEKAYDIKVTQISERQNEGMFQVTDKYGTRLDKAWTSEVLLRDMTANISDYHDMFMEILASAGQNAHKINLEMILGKDFESHVALIPRAVKNAEAFLSAYIDHELANGNSTSTHENAVIAQRDVNFLKQISEGLGEDPSHLLRYGSARGVVERQALLNNVQIADNREKNWSRGMEKLVASSNKAEKNDPSFRKMIEERRAKPQLPILGQ